MPLSLLIGYKIDVATEICAQWRTHFVPSAQITHRKISTATNSNIVDLRAYASKRIDRERTRQPGQPK
jgi:hypothetical protein